jgi:hypothetical protein
MGSFGVGASVGILLGRRKGRGVGTVKDMVGEEGSSLRSRLRSRSRLSESGRVMRGRHCCS